MPQADLDEGGVFFCGVDRRRLADDPEKDPRDPHLQPEADRRGDGAVQNRDAPWRAGHHHGLGQTAMNGYGVSFQHLIFPSDQRAAAEGEEGEKEARRRESDRKPEDDLNETPETA